MWTDDVFRLLTLQDSSTRTVLLGTGALGLAGGVVGSFAVLRRRSLVSDAVAHAALPGIALTYLATGRRDLWLFLLGAMASGLLAASAIALIRGRTRIKEDAAIGLVIGSFFGLGIALSGVIQHQPGGNRAGLDGFLFGKAASMVASDAALISAVAAASVLAILTFYKEWKLLCFDTEFASALGRPSTWLDVALLALICTVTVAGLPAVGVVLMVAMLTIPALAARLWTDRLGVMLVLAGAIGLLASTLGTALSATLPAPSSGLSRGWPTGPLIVLVASSAFMVSLMLAPRRGVVARALRHAALRRRIARQHLLRAAYERLEPGGDMGAPWTPSELPRIPAQRTLLRARADGLIEAHAGAWRLTQTGISEAARIVRAHRLWELFLVEHASLAPSIADRDADEIEHLLTPEMVARLERRPGVPSSPHPLAGRAPEGAR